MLEVGSVEARDSRVGKTLPAWVGLSFTTSVAPSIAANITLLACTSALLIFKQSKSSLSND